MTDAEKDLQADPDLDFFVRSALERKAGSLVVLDVRGITAFADYFVIMSAKSNRQAIAIAEHISMTMKRHGRYALSIDGKTDGQWVLMDYDDVIIHVFYEPVRSFFDLEGLWVDARKIETPAMTDEALAKAALVPADWDGDEDDDDF